MNVGLMLGRVRLIERSRDCRLVDTDGAFSLALLGTFALLAEILCSVGCFDWI